MEGTLRMFLFVFVLLFVVNYASTIESHFKDKTAENLSSDDQLFQAELPLQKTDRNPWIQRYFVGIMMNFLLKCGVNPVLVEKFHHILSFHEDKLAFGLYVAVFGFAFLFVVSLCCKRWKSAKRGVSHTDLVLNLQARIRILEDQCNEKDAENLALQDDLAEAKKKQISSDEAAAAAGKNLKRMAKKVGRCEEQRINLWKSIEEHSTLIEKLNKQLHHQLNQDDNQSKHHEAVVQDLNSQIRSLQDQLEIKNSEFAKMEKALCEANAKNVSLEKQIKNKSSKEAAVQLQHESEKLTEKELEELRTKYDELNNLANGLREQFRSQLANVEQKCHDYWLKLRSQERELDEVKRERNWVKQRLELERLQPRKNAPPHTEKHIPHQPAFLEGPVTGPPRATPPGYMSYGPFYVPPGVPPPPVYPCFPSQILDGHKHEFKHEVSRDMGPPVVISKNPSVRKSPVPDMGPPVVLSNEPPVRKSPVPDVVLQATPPAPPLQHPTGLRSCYYL